MSPHKPELASEEPHTRRSHFGSSLLTPRDKGGLLLTGEQTYVRYDALGQQFAPDYEPATDVVPLGLRRPREQREQVEHNVSTEKPKRGGYRGATAWPTDYRKRIHAVGSVVDRWEKKMGYVKTWRPTLDQPKWVTLTEAGLRRIGLPYSEVDWPENDGDLMHYHHVTMVRLYLARRRTEHIPKHTWICERELLLRDMTSKWAANDLPTRPDGVLMVEEDGTMQLANGEIVPVHRGQEIAIEVELSRKNFASYEHRVFPDHLHRYAAVWYFCAPDAYHAVLTARQHRLKTDEERARIVIRQLEY